MSPIVLYPQIPKHFMFRIIRVRYLQIGGLQLWQNYNFQHARYRGLLSVDFLIDLLLK